MPFLGQIDNFGQKLHIFYFFTHFRKYLTQLLSVMGETGFCHIVTRHGLQALADVWPRCDREVTTLNDLWPRCDQSVTTLTDLWPGCDQSVTILTDLWPRCDQYVTSLTDL